MSIEAVCRDFSGASSFRSPTRGSAVWFHDDGDGVSRISWQGNSLVRAVQNALGVTVDGAWGPETNAALRSRMAAMGMDTSPVRDGEVNVRSLEAAIAVLYTLSTVGSGATSPAVRICVPGRATLPRWREAPPRDRGDVAVSALVERNGEPATEAPRPRWRRPADSVVVDSGLSESDDTHFVVYRLASGSVRRATIAEDGSLIEDRAATPDEAAGVGNPNLTRATIDPGTLAPGETAAPPSGPDPRGYAAPPQRSLPISPLAIAAAAGVALLLSAIVVVGIWPAAPPPPPPPPPVPASPKQRNR